MNAIYVKIKNLDKFPLDRLSRRNEIRIMIEQKSICLELTEILFNWNIERHLVIFDKQNKCY